MQVWANSHHGGLAIVHCVDPKSERFADVLDSACGHETVFHMEDARGLFSAPDPPTHVGRIHMPPLKAQLGERRRKLRR